jgi:hypothetical protein
VTDEILRQVLAEEWNGDQNLIFDPRPELDVFSHSSSVRERRADESYKGDREWKVGRRDRLSGMIHRRAFKTSQRAWGK